MEVEHYRCRDCRYRNEKCKRIDHKTIKFAKPWFKSYDGDNHIVCSDFKPALYMKYANEHWTCFEEYWKGFVEQWLPYGDTSKNVYFTLHDDTSIRYGVPMMDFVNGTMIENGVLKAVEKMYYKRTKEGFGYKLIREPISGVNIHGTGKEF